MRPLLPTTICAACDDCRSASPSSPSSFRGLSSSLVSFSPHGHRCARSCRQGSRQLQKPRNQGRGTIGLAAWSRVGANTP